MNLDEIIKKYNIPEAAPTIDVDEVIKKYNIDVEERGVLASRPARIAVKALKPVGMALNVAHAPKIMAINKLLGGEPLREPWLAGWGDILAQAKPEVAFPVSPFEPLKEKGFWARRFETYAGSGITRGHPAELAIFGQAAPYVLGFVMDVFDPTDPINWLNPAKLAKVGKFARLRGAPFTKMYNTKFQQWLDVLPSKIADPRLGAVENQRALFGKVIFAPGGSVDDAVNAVNDLMKTDLRTLEQGFDKTLEAAHIITQNIKKTNPEQYAGLVKEVGKELGEIGIKQDTARTWYTTIAYPFTSDEKLLLREGIEEGSKLRRAGEVLRGQRALKPFEFLGLRRPRRRAFRMLPEYGTRVEYGVGAIGEYGADLSQQARNIVKEADPSKLTHILTKAKKQILHPDLNLGILINKHMDEGMDLADAVTAAAFEDVKNPLTKGVKKKLGVIDRMLAKGATPEQIDAQPGLRVAEGLLESKKLDIEKRLPRANLLFKAEQDIEAAKLLGDVTGVKTATTKWKDFLRKHDKAIRAVRKELAQTERIVNLKRRIIIDVVDVVPIDEQGAVIKLVDAVKGKPKWRVDKILVREPDGTVRFVTDPDDIAALRSARTQRKLTQKEILTHVMREPEQVVDETLLREGLPEEAPKPPAEPPKPPEVPPEVPEPVVTRELEVPVQPPEPPVVEPEVPVEGIQVEEVPPIVAEAAKQEWEMMPEEWAKSRGIPAPTSKDFSEHKSIVRTAIAEGKPVEREVAEAAVLRKEWEATLEEVIGLTAEQKYDNIIQKYEQAEAPKDFHALDAEVNRLLDDVTGRPDLDDKLEEAYFKAKSKLGLPGIIAAPIVFDESEFDTDKPWQRTLHKVIGLSVLAGVAGFGGVKGMKYWRRRGLKLAATKAGVKILTPNADEVIARIAKTTQDVIERAGRHTEELSRLEREATLLQEAGLQVAKPVFVQDPAVTRIVSTIWDKLGIPETSRIAVQQAFTEAIPPDVQDTYRDITYRSRWIGEHAKRVASSTLKDIQLLAEVEGIDRGRLAKALNEEAIRGIMDYTADELGNIDKITRSGFRKRPFRQRRYNELARQMNALGENFGRFVNTDEVNRLIDEINPTLAPEQQLKPIVREAGEPLTVEQLRTAMEVSNHEFKNLLSQTDELSTLTGLDELPLIQSMSPSGQAAAVNIAARIGSLYEYSRAIEDIARRPFGVMTDWLKEERLTYAYHMLTREARKTKADLQAAFETPFVGTTTPRKHSVRMAHDEMRSLFPGYSITEINRLGRASTSKNITQLESVLATMVEVPIDTLPKNVQSNPLIRLAKDMNIDQETILNSARGYIGIFGKSLKQTLIDDPSFLVGVRLSSTQKIMKTGALITEMMKFGLPKSLIWPGGKPKSGPYKNWASLSVAAALPEGDPSKKIFSGMLFPPEIKRMVDASADKLLTPPTFLGRTLDRNGMTYKTLRAMDHSLILMKTQALGTTSFLSMNIISALWRNYAEDVPFSGYLNMGTFMKSGEVPQGFRYNAKEMQEIISAGTATGFIASELKKPIAAQSKFTKTVYQILGGDIPLGQPLPPSTLNALNEQVETFVRGSHIFGKIEQGFSANDAIRSSLHAQFDYASDTYGKVFQHSFKVLPFAKWQIRNIPYTFGKLFTHPRKIRMEVFNAPKLAWQMFEPHLPEDLQTDLRYAPGYRLDRMPVPIATYTDENGIQHAATWMLGSQLPSAEPFFMGSHTFSNEFQGDIMAWAGSLIGMTGRDVLRQTRPEISGVIETAEALAKRRTPYGTPVRNPEQLAYFMAMRVIPLQRLFRIAQIGGLDVKHIRPIVKTTNYDAVRRGFKSAAIIPFLIGNNLYVYDVRQEGIAAVQAMKAARGMGKREIMKMRMRGEDVKAIDREINQLYRQLTIQRDRFFGEITTKGGR